MIHIVSGHLNGLLVLARWDLDVHRVPRENIHDKSIC